MSKTRNGTVNCCIQLAALEMRAAHQKKAKSRCFSAAERGGRRSRAGPSRPASLGGTPRDARPDPARSGPRNMLCGGEWVLGAPEVRTPPADRSSPPRRRPRRRDPGGGDAGRRFVACGRPHPAAGDDPGEPHGRRVASRAAHPGLRRGRRSPHGPPRRDRRRRRPRAGRGAPDSQRCRSGRHRVLPAAARRRRVRALLDHRRTRRPQGGGGGRRRCGRGRRRPRAGCAFQRDTTPRARPECCRRCGPLPLVLRAGGRGRIDARARLGSPPGGRITGQGDPQPPGPAGPGAGFLTAACRHPRARRCHHHPRHPRLPQRLAEPGPAAGPRGRHGSDAAAGRRGCRRPGGVGTPAEPGAVGLDVPAGGPGRDGTGGDRFGDIAHRGALRGPLR